MRVRTLTCVTGAAVVTALLCGARPASAQAVITNGSGIALGVNAEGHLNTFPSSGSPGTDPDHPFSTNAGGNIGVALFQDWGSGTPEWRDATAPGCLCEGWGVSANGTNSGYANVSSDGGATT